MLLGVVFKPVFSKQLEPIDQRGYRRLLFPGVMLYSPQLKFAVWGFCWLRSPQNLSLHLVGECSKDLHENIP